MHNTSNSFVRIFILNWQRKESEVKCRNQHERKTTMKTIEPVCQRCSGISCKFTGEQLCGRAIPIKLQSNF